MIKFNIFSNEIDENEVNFNSFEWIEDKHKIIWLGNNEFKIESENYSNIVNLSFVPENLYEAKKAIKNLMKSKNNFILNKNLQTY